jgi:hypothetical protein
MDGKSIFNQQIHQSNQMCESVPGLSLPFNLGGIKLCITIDTTNKAQLFSVTNSMSAGADVKLSAFGASKSIPIIQQTGFSWGCTNTTLEIIVGAVVAGVLLIGSVCICVFCCCRRKAPPAQQLIVVQGSGAQPASVGRGAEYKARVDDV